MGSRTKYVRKILSWGGNRRELESVQVYARRFTDDQEAIEMVTLFYNLMANTDFLSTLGYEVLIMKQPINLIAAREKRKKTALHKAMWRQYNKIEKLFADDLIELIKEPEQNRGKIAYYTLLLTDLNAKYKTNVQKRISKLFTFDIESFAESDLAFNYEVTAEDFEALHEALQMTIKPFMAEMIAQLDPRYLGYLVYLMQGDKYNLTERDLARREELKAVWLLEI